MCLFVWLFVFVLGFSSETASLAESSVDQVFTPLIGLLLLFQICLVVVSFSCWFCFVLLVCFCLCSRPNQKPL